MTFSGWNKANRVPNRLLPVQVDAASACASSPVGLTKSHAEEQLAAVAEGRFSTVDVELEAQDVVSASGRAPCFGGFAGCIKAQLEWLPLQWTYLAENSAFPSFAGCQS
jgi:hypothetical protein